MWRSALALAIAAAAGCDNDWRTDMWYQASRRPEDAPRAEPEHSVSVGAPPLLADRDEAEDLTNPVAADARSRAHGARLYADRCACCHGDGGHGGGPVSKFFPPAPDLAYVTIRAHSDGYLYGTVVLGGRAMPPQAEGLSVRDRWDVVNQVRALQRSAPATVKAR